MHVKQRFTFLTKNGESGEQDQYHSPCHLFNNDTLKNSK